MKIQDFINKRDKFKIDYTYQRPNKVWSLQDNQCLIDTILRSEPLPLFFLNKKEEDGNEVYYIVDGQQRLNCIRQFYDNKIRLSEKFSGEAYEGKTFNGDNALSDEDKEKFLNFELKTHIMNDYDDERVRMIFSRLQRGKPLNLGERLNALPGDIVVAMREIAKHHFVTEVIDIKDDRYEKYPDVARMMYYEVYGAKNCSPDDLYKFFDNYKKISLNSKVYRDVMENLNYLDRCFGDGKKYAFFRKHAWIMAVYSMVRELRKMYAMTGQEKQVRDFVVRFAKDVYDEDMRMSNYEYAKFYDNVRGGWSEKIQLFRRKVLTDKFLEKNDIPELDSRRQISEDEKIAAFAKHPNCERCGKQLNAFNEAEYHHITRYADGGSTALDNIQVLCTECHDIVHGKKIEKNNDEDLDEEIDEE